MFISPLKRDAFSSTHCFIQLIPKAKNPLQSQSTKTKKGKPEGGNRTNLASKRIKKGINHILLVKCSFNYAYILALEGSKRKEKKKMETTVSETALTQRGK